MRLNEFFNRRAKQHRKLPGHFQADGSATVFHARPHKCYVTSILKTIKPLHLGDAAGCVLG